MSDEPADNASREETGQPGHRRLYLAAVQAGQSPSPQEWLGRHPDLAAELAIFFADKQHFEGAAAALHPIEPAALVRPATHLVCPHCRNAIELVLEAGREEVLCPSCG